MPNPDRLAVRFAIVQRRKCVRVVRAGELPAEFRIKRLDVEQQQIGRLDHAPRVRQRICARGVERGVETRRPAAHQEFARELRLRERLPARKRHAAGADEVPARFDLPHQFRNRDLPSAVERLRIGVVTVAATQRTPLQKHDEPHPGAVERTEALERMNSAVNLLHGLSPLLKAGCGTCGSPRRAAARGSTG